MTYTLYGSRRSGSLIVELALAQIGVEYEIQDVDLEVEGQRQATYAAVNPQRKVPALITPAGEVLTETVAILLTLEERHANAALLPPAGSVERARALRVMLFVATELYPIVEINDYPERFAPNPADAPAVREVARALWRDRWLLVEDAIEGDPFLLPAGCCMTDIYIAVVSRWAQQDAWRTTHTPKVERLTNAIAERSPFAAVWARHQPAAPNGSRRQCKCRSYSNQQAAGMDRPR